MRNFMVFDIGGSAIKWSVATENGTFLCSGSLDVPKTAELFFELLSQHTLQYKEQYDIQGMALSSPGAVDCETGFVEGASAVEYIHGPNFKEILQGKTGLRVELENDANCAALGECWLGASEDVLDSAFVICGSGIGGALVKDKKVHHGIHKHGGEFGYFILDVDPTHEEPYRTWSTIGSTFALANAVADRIGVERSTFNGKKVFELYDLGNEIAIEEVNKFYMYMAIGIFTIQYTFDPEVIVLGGAISERPGYLEAITEKMNDILDKVTIAKVRPVIRLCQHGNDANKLGALYHYLQREAL